MNSQPGDSTKGLRTPRETDSWMEQQILVFTRTQEKGAVIPQETRPDLTVSIQDSLAEFCQTVAVATLSGLLRSQGN